MNSLRRKLIVSTAICCLAPLLMAGNGGCGGGGSSNTGTNTEKEAEWFRQKDHDRLEKIEAEKQAEDQKRAAEQRERWSTPDQYGR